MFKSTNKVEDIRIMCSFHLFSTELTHICLMGQGVCFYTLVYKDDGKTLQTLSFSHAVPAPHSVSGVRFRDKLISHVCQTYVQSSVTELRLFLWTRQTPARRHSSAYDALHASVELLGGSTSDPGWRRMPGRPRIVAGCVTFSKSLLRRS